MKHASFAGIAVALILMGQGCAAPQKELAPQEEPMKVSVEQMKAFMAENPPDSEVATSPIPEMQKFTAQIKASGAFQNLNYMTAGDASIQEKDGKLFLVFGDNFDTPDGPDLQIYLTKNTKPTERQDIPAGIPLGKIKSIKGKQVYQLPDGTNIADYHSVTIHCKAFNVPWSYAPLQ